MGLELNVLPVINYIFTLLVYAFGGGSMNLRINDQNGAGSAPDYF